MTDRGTCAVSGYNLGRDSKSSLHHFQVIQHRPVHPAPPIRIGCTYTHLLQSHCTHVAIGLGWIQIHLSPRRDMVSVQSDGTFSELPLPCTFALQLTNRHPYRWNGENLTNN